MQPDSPGRETGLAGELCGSPNVRVCSPQIVPIAGIVLTGVSTTTTCGEQTINKVDIVASFDVRKNEEVRKGGERACTLENVSN